MREEGRGKEEREEREGGEGGEGEKEERREREEREESEERKGRDVILKNPSYPHTLTQSHAHTLTHLQGPSETVCDPVRPRSRPVLLQTWPQTPGWAAEGHHHGRLPWNVGEINGPLVCMGQRNLPHIPPFTPSHCLKSSVSV